MSLWRFNSIDQYEREVITITIFVVHDPPAQMRLMMYFCFLSTYQTALLMAGLICAGMKSLRVVDSADGPTRMPYSLCWVGASGLNLSSDVRFI